VPALSGVTHAATSSLYFKPIGMMANGSSYSVQVRANTGGLTADTVQADFTYPTSVLTFTSITPASEPFEVETSGTAGGGGSVSIQRGSTNDVTGDILVATVTFQVVAQGTADLSFQNGSTIMSSGVDFLDSKIDLHAVGVNGPLQSVHRLANWITHERLFTTSAHERDNAVANIPGWVYEGVAFSAGP
jgi:hypothetical protein